MATVSRRRWLFNVETETIDVTCGLPSPNEQWRFTDAQGHEHRYDHGYPTLELVIDASHWCDGYEGWMRHDPHEQIDESHYECRECRETIEPALDPAYTVKKIPGMTTCTAVGVLADGREVTAWLTADELDQAIREEPPDEFMERLVADHPEKVIASRWSS